MAAAVAAFSRNYPEVTVEVHSIFRDVDMLAENFDLTVRYDKLEDSSFVARRLGGHTLCLCAAPSYWEEKGMPTHPTISVCITAWRHLIAVGCSVLRTAATSSR